jgi:hypothetical protein
MVELPMTLHERNKPEDWRQDSLVSIVMGYRLNGQSSNIFPFSTEFRLALGSTQPPIQWVPVAISLEAKWLGHEADHSRPFSAKDFMA